MTTKFTDSQFKNFTKCDCAEAWTVIKHDVISQLLGKVKVTKICIAFTPKPLNYFIFNHELNAHFDLIFKCCKKSLMQYYVP